MDVSAIQQSTKHKTKTVGVSEIESAIADALGKLLDSKIEVVVNDQQFGEDGIHHTTTMNINVLEPYQL